jgi:hypothetical protein
MTTHAKIFLLLIAAVSLGVVFVVTNSDSQEESNSEVIDEMPATDNQELTFDWSFGEAETNNLDGFSQTNVFLTVKRSDEDAEEILIDTVDGGCSQIGDDEDNKIQCYYAGLGQEYRVVAGEDSYIVERKYFEEGLPNVTLEDYEWETLTEVSF